MLVNEIIIILRTKHDRWNNKKSAKSNLKRLTVKHELDVPLEDKYTSLVLLQDWDDTEVQLERYLVLVVTGETPQSA